jgi:phage shock protein A
MALTVDDIKEWLGSLEQKRDELRLQAHLLGMEARDEFDKVDQSIDKFRGAVQWVSSTASAAAREAPTTIKTGAEKLTRTVSDSITELRAAHADTLDTLKQRAGELHTEIEKATLSLQDAVGSLKDKAGEASADLRRRGEEAKMEFVAKAGDAKTQIEGKLEEMKERSELVSEGVKGALKGMAEDFSRHLHELHTDLDNRLTALKSKIGSSGRSEDKK